MQDSREEAVRHWYTLTQTLTLVVFPLLGALATNAEDLIRVLVAEKWLASVEPMRFLCIVSAMKSITPVTNNMLSGLGRTDMPFKFSMLNLVTLFPAFLVGCYFGGLRGVYLAWIIAFPLVCGWLLWRATRITGTSIQRYLAALRFPVITTGVCVIAMVFAGISMPSGIVRLLFRCVVGLACYSVCLYMYPPSRQQILGILTKVRARVAA
jgi:O-antigen/teichoic acid export membrane protein